MNKNQAKRAVSLLREIVANNFGADNAFEVEAFLAQIDNKPKKKSTTHREKFYFFNESNGVSTPSGHWIVGGTVFFRQEKDGWYYSMSLCSQGDQFSRDQGRSHARRRYFNTKCKLAKPNEEPDYTKAHILYFGFAPTIQTP